MPLAIERWKSYEMKRVVSRLRRDEAYDQVVCDFLAPAPNFESLDGVVLFQHNVETMIWRRHADNASGVLKKKRYFADQAKRMFDYEREVCHAVDRVVAVSEADAETMRRELGAEKVDWAPTGVDTEFFSSPARAPAPVADLVFLGSMDWMPNIDGVNWFAEEILPKIRHRRPETTVAIVGRFARRGDPGAWPRPRPIHRHGDRAGRAPLLVGLEGFDRAVAHRRRDSAEDLRIDGCRGGGGVDHYRR